MFCSVCFVCICCYVAALSLLSLEKTGKLLFCREAMKTSHFWLQSLLYCKSLNLCNMFNMALDKQVIYYLFKKSCKILLSVHMWLFKTRFSSVATGILNCNFWPEHGISNLDVTLDETVHPPKSNSRNFRNPLDSRPSVHCILCFSAVLKMLPFYRI